MADTDTDTGAGAAVAEAPPAAPAAAPAPPAPAPEPAAPAPAPRAPRARRMPSMAEAHDSLTSGFTQQRRERAARQPEQRTSTGEAPPAPKVDSPPAEGVVSAQQAQQQTPAAPPSGERAAQAEPPAAATAAPAGGEAPAATTPPKAEAAQAAPTPPAPRQIEAPAEFVSEVPDYHDLVNGDPLLKNTVRRIWANPTLSEAQKAAQTVRHLDGARSARSRVAQQQAEESQLWEEGRFEELSARRQQAIDTGQQQAERAQAVTRLLSTAFSVDSADPDFLGAGPRAGDENVEVGLQRFIDWATQKSPPVLAAIGAAEKLVEARYEARIAELTKAHEQALKEQETRLLDRAKADVEEARGSLRAGNGRVPPRATPGTPPGAEARPVRVPDLATIRDNLAAGFRARTTAN